MNQRVPPPGGRLARLRQLTRRLGERDGLLRRTVDSVMWRFGGHGVAQVLRLASNLELTRLLAPEAFGLMAAVFTIQTGFAMMTDIGLNQSIMRGRHGDDPVFLRTAWTLSLIKFALMGLLIVGAATLLGLLQAAVDLGDTIYADPTLPAIMTVMAALPLLKGLESSNQFLAERRLRVSRLITVDVCCQIVGIAALIGFAMIEPTVWALAWGGLVGPTLRCVLTHIVLPGPRMGLTWNRPYVHEIWGFGRWVVVASLFNFLARQGDRLLLAALLTPLGFSYYVIARLWIDAGNLTIARISRPVMIGVIGEVSRNRPDALSRVFNGARLAHSSLCVAAFMAALLGGEWLIRSLYTETFAPVGPLIAALAPVMLVQMYQPFVNLLQNAGDSRSIARVTFARSIALVVMIPAAYFLLGERWMVFAIAINAAWGVPRLVALAGRIVPLHPMREYVLLGAVVTVSLAASLLA